MLQTLSVQDVVQIHEFIAEEFARSHDPISPAGVRDRGLLESAVSRQHVGMGGTLKYADPILNAATLMFGVCNNHPFFNGNKRTSLVCLAAHLDKNKLQLSDVNDTDVYSMVLHVARGRMAAMMAMPGSEGPRAQPDREVIAIGKWIESRVQTISKGERQITYRELRRILAKHGLELAPSSGRGNSADVFKMVTTRGVLGRERTERKRIHTIGYHSEGATVSISEIKGLRRRCGLSDADGVDSDAFYDHKALTDSLLLRYRSVLKGLARK